MEVVGACRPPLGHDTRCQVQSRSGSAFGHLPPAARPADDVLLSSTSRLIAVIRRAVKRRRRNLTVISTENAISRCVDEALGLNSTTRTPATNTGYGHHQRTSSQQFYNKFATSQCQSLTSRHAKMLGCGKFFVRWWCSLVVFVVGVRSRCPCSGVRHLLSLQTSA